MRTIVVFDLDDTLYPERDFAISGFKAAEAWAHGALGVSMGLAEEMTRSPRRRSSRTALRDGAQVASPGAHTRSWPLVRVWRDHPPDIQLFDDAAWALEHYGARGPLGLITDGTHGMQRRKVERVGIAPRFDEWCSRARWAAATSTSRIRCRTRRSKPPSAAAGKIASSTSVTTREGFRGAERAGLGERDGAPAGRAPHPFRNGRGGGRRAAAHHREPAATAGGARRVRPTLRSSSDAPGCCLSHACLSD